MKKFILSLVFALVAVFGFNTFAQISYTKPEAKKYEFLGMGRVALTHYFANDAYTLRVAALEDSVDSSAFIELGKGKSQAIESLNNIKKMMLDCEDGGYVEIAGKKWHLHVYSSGKSRSLSYMQEYNISSNYIDLDNLEKLIRDFTNNTLEVW